MSSLLGTTAGASTQPPAQRVNDDQQSGMQMDGEVLGRAPAPEDASANPSRGGPLEKKAQKAY